MDPGERLALIIGNNAYSRAALKNAANDARAMDATLRELGFETDVLTDANARAMQIGVSRLPPMSRGLI